MVLHVGLHQDEVIHQGGAIYGLCNSHHDGVVEGAEELYQLGLAQLEEIDMELY